MSDFVDRMAEHTHREQAAPWDPVGLMLGDAEQPIDSIGVCHEVTDAVLDRLDKRPVDLLVTYHPLLFTPTHRIVAERSAGSRAFRLLKMNTALLVSHTDFDTAPGGAADALADFFDLRDVESFGGDPEAGEPSIGRVGEFDAKLAVLDARVSDAFGYTGLRVSGDPETHIDRLAVIPGSGSSLIDEAAEVADALVTGDVPHHRAVRAADLGLAIVDPGHVATERPGMKALVTLVRRLADTQVVDLTELAPQTWG
ncbi:MAG: Nif3-like dinuclear metal center hexameric protein [Acidimicrobiia bacterium]|nr:Nif3-like dinuclear metal center hexameric protein [Acidimicrobiia bacterium]